MSAPNEPALVESAKIITTYTRVTRDLCLVYGVLYDKVLSKEPPKNAALNRLYYALIEAAGPDDSTPTLTLVSIRHTIANTPVSDYPKAILSQVIGSDGPLSDLKQGAYIRKIVSLLASRIESSNAIKHLVAAHEAQLDKAWAQSENEFSEKTLFGFLGKEIEVPDLENSLVLDLFDPEKVNPSTVFGLPDALLVDHREISSRHNDILDALEVARSSESITELEYQLYYNIALAAFKRVMGQYQQAPRKPAEFIRRERPADSDVAQPSTTPKPNPNPGEG